MINFESHFLPLKPSESLAFTERKNPMIIVEKTAFMKIVRRNSSLKYSHKADKNASFFTDFLDLSCEILVGNKLNDDNLEEEFDENLCIFSENDIVNDIDGFDSDTQSSRSDLEEILFEDGFFDGFANIL